MAERVDLDDGHMPRRDPAELLERAVAAYAKAQEGIDEARVEARELARRHVDAARDRAEIARRHLAEAIVAADRAGFRQRDIVAVTGYSRERVRQIVRAAGD